MAVNHWLDLRTGKSFVPDLEQFGFVYIITNLKTEKKYIGCKQYLIGNLKDNQDGNLTWVLQSI